MSESFMSPDKKLLICLMIIQKLDLKPSTKHDKKEGKGLKILTPKQMLQRLPIALAQVKPGNNSESLLNEISQIVYYLYQSKQITKNVYKHIIESIQ